MKRNFYFKKEFLFLFREKFNLSSSIKTSSAKLKWIIHKRIHRKYIPFGIFFFFKKKCKLLLTLTSHVFNDNHRFYENSFDRVGKRVKLGKWNVELRFKNRGSIFLSAILFISYHRYLLYNFLIILYIEYIFNLFHCPKILPIHYLRITKISIRYQIFEFSGWEILYWEGRGMTHKRAKLVLSITEPFHPL